MTVTQARFPATQSESTSRLDKLALVAVVLAYGLTRLYGLMNLPVFGDEAIHVFRAIDWEVREAFVRGKLLPVVTLHPFMSLPVDPLLVARLQVVVLGFITLLAIIWIGNRLFSFRAGWLSGLIYVLLPFALFFNRLDVADDFELAFAALILVYSIKIAYQPGKTSDAVILAVIFAISFVAKITSVIFFVLPPLAVIALRYPGDLRPAMRTIFPAMLVAGIVAIGLIVFGYGALEFDSKGTRSLSIIPANIGQTFEWYWVYLTPVGCALVLISAISRDRRVLLLTLIFLMVPATYIVVGGRIFSRYVLVSLVPASVMVGYLLTRWLAGRQRLDAIRNGAVIGLLAISLIPADLTMITHPLDSYLPAYDLVQYVTGFPTASGINQMLDTLGPILDADSDRKEVVLIGGRPNMHVMKYLLFQHKTTRIKRVGIEEAHDLETLPNRWIIVDRSVYPKADMAGKTMIWNYVSPAGVKGLEIWR